MRNFNTNQARHVYVAKSVVDNAAALANPGDIAVGFTAPNATIAEADLYGKQAGCDMFFSYMNGDGIKTRSDTIDLQNIEYVTLKNATALVEPLYKTTVKLKAGIDLSKFVGKDFNITVMLRQYLDLDPSSTRSIVASSHITSTKTEADVYKELAKQLLKACGNAAYPFYTVKLGDTVVKTAAQVDAATATNLVIVEAAQKWVRGKMQVDPIPFDVFASVVDVDGEDTPWATCEKARADVLSGNYALADLEYFSYGERGDTLRGSAWPNNYEPVYLIDPAGDLAYGCLTIQYFWCGHAENVQKSPRTIQIVAPDSVLTALVAKLPEDLKQNPANKAVSA